MFLLLAAGLSWLDLSLIGYVDDDAYIHFRIAENLLTHGRPYFNPSEPIMASSSSGWTTTLFILFSIFGTGINVVSVFNAAVTALNVFVYARIAGGIVGRDGVVGWLISALVVVPVTLISSAGLMETPLALLVLGIGVLLYQRGDARAFLFFSAAVFFRLELVLFAAAFGAHSLARKSMHPAKALGYCVLGAAPFVIYNMAFFGTNIPHAVIAKRLVYSLEPSWVLRLALPALPPGGYPGKVAMLVLVLWASALALFGAARDKAGRDGTFIPFLASGVAVLLSYFAGRAFVFQWYTPLFALPILLSITAYAVGRRSAALGVLAAMVFMPYAAEFGNNVHAAWSDPASSRYFESCARTRKYIEVGGRLRAKYPDCTLMSSEIGGLGYGFKGYVYDACGLASEGALKYHPMKVPQERHDGASGAIPPGYVREAGPDIIVSYDSFALALMKSDALDGYVAMREDVFTKPDMALSGGKGVWGNRNLNVFIRRDKYSGAF